MKQRPNIQWAEARTGGILFVHHYRPWDLHLYPTSTSLWRSLSYPATSLPFLKLPNKSVCYGTQQSIKVLKRMSCRTQKQIKKWQHMLCPIHAEKTHCIKNSILMKKIFLPYTREYCMTLHNCSCFTVHLGQYPILWLRGWWYVWKGYSSHGMVSQLHIQ